MEIASLWIRRKIMNLKIVNIIINDVQIPMKIFMLFLKSNFYFRPKNVEFVQRILNSLEDIIIAIATKFMEIL